MNPTLFTFYNVENDVVDTSQNLGINDVLIFDKTQNKYIADPTKQICCKICFDILSQKNKIINSHRNGNIYFKHHCSTLFCTMKNISSEYESSIFFNKSGSEFINIVKHYFDSINNFSYKYKSDCCINNPNEYTLTIRDKNTIRIFDNHIIFDNVFLSFKDKLECTDAFIHLYCTKDSFIKYIINWKHTSTSKSLSCQYIHHTCNRMCERCETDKNKYLSTLNPNIKDLIQKKYLKYLPPCKLDSILTYLYKNMDSSISRTDTRIENNFKVITYEYYDYYMFMNSNIVNCIVDRLKEDGFKPEIDNVKYTYKDFTQSISNFKNNISFDDTKLRSCINNIFEIYFSFNFVYKVKNNYNFTQQYIVYKLKTSDVSDTCFLNKIIDKSYDFNYKIAFEKKYKKQIIIRNEIISHFKKDWDLYNTIADYIELPKPIPFEEPIKTTYEPRPRPQSPIIPAPKKKETYIACTYTYKEYEDKIHKPLTNTELHRVSNYKRLKLFVLLNDYCDSNYNYPKFHDEINFIRKDRMLKNETIENIVKYYNIQNTKKVIQLLDELEIDIDTESIEDIHNHLYRNTLIK